jgi:hypothetical protein
VAARKLIGPPAWFTRLRAGNLFQALHSARCSGQAGLWRELDVLDIGLGRSCLNGGPHGEEFIRRPSCGRNRPICCNSAEQTTLMRHDSAKAPVNGSGGFAGWDGPHTYNQATDALPESTDQPQG